MTQIRTVTAGPEHASGLVALFERSGVGCFCRYWHFTGDKNAWQERCAFSPETNRDQMVSALGEGSDEMRGVVALSTGSDEVVGWLKVSPAHALRKLYDQRPYRGLPVLGGDLSEVFTVGCALVDPAFRRKKVASQMIEHAVQVARDAGARAIDAFPFEAPEPDDALLWMGPSGAFRQAGWSEIARIGPYPVLRLNL